MLARQDRAERNRAALRIYNRARFVYSVFLYPILRVGPGLPSCRPAARPSVVELPNLRTWHAFAFAFGTLSLSDADHVLEDLRDRFDRVLADLESAAGWQTERVARPVLILGRFDGILTGIRQLRRTRPLETEEIAGLRVPTLAEMARIKAWLLATRNTVRDYLDTVVLLERLGEDGGRRALAPFDAIYAQSTGASPLAEVAERLGAADPSDLARAELATYRGLAPPWNDWHHLTSCGHRLAPLVACIALEEPP